MKLILPDPLLFGFNGSAPFPWLMLLSRTHAYNAALIAHERCHQAQQRRDGVLRFWWRYTMNKAWRLAYEADAYKAWLEVAPQDEWRVVHWLAHNYNLGLTTEQVQELLGVSV